MLGMSFVSFLTLTIVGAVVAAVYHWVLQYRLLQGLDSAFGKLLVGWIGAWLGSPVLGHWWWKIGDVYIVPAILGAIATIHLSVLAVKEFAQFSAARPLARTEEMPRSRAASA